MEIGAFIKLQRIKREMTQEELARGIVSMSYLSKIENQKTEASPEVISLLCTRLGLEIDSERDMTIKEKCQNWYDSLYEVNDKQEIIDTYEELNELLSLVRSDSLAMFEIHKVRYYLVLGEYDKALEQINKLNDMSSAFDNLHQYYWYKFKGNYSYLNGDLNNAMRMYNMAEEKVTKIYLKETEVADLNYVIAVTHSNLRNTLEAMEYAEKAIDIFQKDYNFYRCAQCHILLGISYRRIRMYDKAIENQSLAKHLGEINNNESIVQLVNQNLGNLYATKGLTTKAIHYYEEVVRSGEDVVKLNERLLAVTSLIKRILSYRQYRKNIRDD
ncbi:helix-turn-helix transcriptional regulator [Virgibacillus sp. 179-BFC.A HS]|uniref:Helix-turn-helix transcriptional regulator n=1 Tax=Tigheibacillus jepli TaxID=3035914 RepID=A0ABU5CJZ4_9BACI|nr:helix-turn-helix transcriptional regulator [Virgibacillus sp. 179-BFC.A HS]MDY0406636.1 helix-turn-helix transcriptional regulator [Virgibacillus sp. 179-BFC.A HS]